MSHPKRYTFVHIGRDVWMHEPDNRMKAAPAGEYVSASDYAALAAENERLKGLYQLALFEWKRGWPPPLMADEINAAKEGRDAK